MKETHWLGYRRGYIRRLSWIQHHRNRSVAGLDPGVWASELSFVSLQIATEYEWALASGVGGEGIRRSILYVCLVSIAFIDFLLQTFCAVMTVNFSTFWKLQKPPWPSVIQNLQSIWWMWSRRRSYFQGTIRLLISSFFRQGNALMHWLWDSRPFTTIYFFSVSAEDHWNIAYSTSPVLVGEQMKSIHMQYVAKKNQHLLS